MEYLSYALLSWLLLFLSGVWLCVVCLPAPLKRYSLVFAPSIGQVEVFGQPGAVLWCLSTSGRSKNALAAASAAKRLGLSMISMTRWRGAQLAAMSDVLLDVPAELTPGVRELHTVIYHFVCERVAGAFSGEAS